MLPHAFRGKKQKEGGWETGEGFVCFDERREVGLKLRISGRRRAAVRDWPSTPPHPSAHATGPGEAKAEGNTDVHALLIYVFIWEVRRVRALPCARAACGAGPGGTGPPNRSRRRRLHSFFTCGPRTGTTGCCPHAPSEPRRPRWRGRVPGPGSAPRTACRTAAG